MKKRCVSTNDPDLSSKDGEFMLMMTLSTLEVKETIAFFRSGNRDWVYIEQLYDVKDIVYLDGLFYVLNQMGVALFCFMGFEL